MRSPPRPPAMQVIQLEIELCPSPESTPVDYATPTAVDLIAEVDMSVESTLKRAVKRDPRSRYRLARDAGIAVAILQRFESGERSITIGTASKLCRALGLELRPVIGQVK